MFERYTERLRRVIFFAHREANELGRAQIEPQHLLLGLIREDPELITRLCNVSIPTATDLRNRIRVTTGEGENLPYRDLPLSPPAKDVLDNTADESRRLNNQLIGTEHLLLGLLRVEGTTAVEILNEHGVCLDIVRDKLRADAP